MVHLTAKMRQKVEKAIDELGYDFSNYSLESLVRHLESKRDRIIDTKGLELSYRTSGAYVQTPHKDFIMYNSNRNQLMQTHGFLHEVGHMVLEHTASVLVAENELEALQQIIERLSLRCHVRIHHELMFQKEENKLEEAEAELFVRLINGRRFAQQRQREIRRNNNVTLLPPFNSKAK